MFDVLGSHIGGMPYALARVGDLIFRLIEEARQAEVADFELIWSIVEDEDASGAQVAMEDLVLVCHL